MNSIGSVTPVRNEVKRHRQQQSAGGAAAPGRRRVIHRETGCGKAEHHHGKKSGHEYAGARIAGEEAIQVAGDAAVVADDEPGQVVQHVMQAGDDQESVKDAVDEEPDLARIEDGPAQRVHAAFERRPTPAEGAGEDETGDASDDRHEPPPAEECEVARQPDFAVAVVQTCRRGSRRGVPRGPRAWSACRPATSASTSAPRVATK